MRIRSLVVLALALSTVLVGLTAGSPADAASAAALSSGSSGYCPTAKGVTVVADFTALGGGVEIRCDPTATSSTDGLDALHGAGFSTAGTAHDGDGFVCRINNQPTPSADSCLNTPPTTAYWSYWSAANKGSWKYSTVGVKGHHVIVGGFEGWRFYSSKVDGKNVVAPHATPTRPPQPVQPTISLGPAASATASHHTASTSKPPSTSTAPKTTGPSATPSESALQPVTPDGTSSTVTPLAAASSAQEASGSGGSPWPFVIGLVVVAVVGGGAGLALYRRAPRGH